MINSQDICKELNRLLSLDYDAINQLTFKRVNCNNWLILDAFAEVTCDSQIGLLGILNSIANRYNLGKIYVKIGYNGDIIKFCTESEL